MRRWRSAFLWSLAVSALLLLCCGGPATVVQAVLNEFADNLRPTGDNESESAADSRRRGILVGEWSVVQPEVEVPGGRLQFGEAWVEERSRSTRRLVWFSAEERVGGYRVHVAYRFYADPVGGRAAKRMLVPEDGRFGIVIGEDGQDDRGVYTQVIDDPNVAGLRLSVVDSFDAPRAKNIRLVPATR